MARHMRLTNLCDSLRESHDSPLTTHELYVLRTEIHRALAQRFTKRLRRAEDLHHEAAHRRYWRQAARRPGKPAQRVHLHLQSHQCRYRK